MSAGPGGVCTQDSARPPPLRTQLGPCWRGRGGGTCPGTPGARLLGDMSAPEGDRLRAVAAWSAWSTRRQSPGELVFPSQPRPPPPAQPSPENSPWGGFCSADGGSGPRAAGFLVEARLSGCHSVPRGSRTARECPVPVPTPPSCLCPPVRSWIKGSRAGCFPGQE